MNVSKNSGLFESIVDRNVKIYVRCSLVWSTIYCVISPISFSNFVHQMSRLRAQKMNVISCTEINTKNIIHYRSWEKKCSTTLFTATIVAFLTVHGLNTKVVANWFLRPICKENMLTLKLRWYLPSVRLKLKIQMKIECQYFFFTYRT